MSSESGSAVVAPPAWPVKSRAVWLWFASMALLFAATAYAAYRYQDYFVQFVQNIRQVTFTGWLAIGACTLLCHAFDFLRLYSLLRVLGYRLKVWTGIQVCAVSEFASVVTPTAELHIPATVYVLSKRGIDSSSATAAVVSKTLYILMWVSLAGVVALLFADRTMLPAWIVENTLFLLVPVSLVVGFFALMVLFAPRIRAKLKTLLERPGIGAWKKWIMIWLFHSTHSLAKIGTSKSPMHFFAHLFAICYIGAYCLTGYCIAQNLGVEISVGRACIVFALSLVVTYIGIVPGSIGVTEVATACLLSNSGITPKCLAVAVLLRFLTRYLMLLPGALIFLHILFSPTSNTDVQSKI